MIAMVMLDRAGIAPELPCAPGPPDSSAGRGPSRPAPAAERSSGRARTGGVEPASHPGRGVKMPPENPAAPARHWHPGTNGMPASTAGFSVVGGVLTPRADATATLEAEGMPPSTQPARCLPPNTLPILWAASPLPFPLARSGCRPTRNTETTRR
jgi:hypothetical protein